MVKNAVCEIDRAYLFNHIHLKETASYAKKVDKLIEEALAIGKPQIAYKLAYVDEKGDDYVVIDGIKFTSKILPINLADSNRVAAFVVTSGTELEEWSKAFDDAFGKLVADGIKEEILRSATLKLFPDISEEFDFGKTAMMNPGSLPEWPLEEQKPLFKLLGDVKGLIGVELSESCLMEPIKSESGFYFPTESNYANCQLCLHEKCPDRKAPFDKDLYENKYQLSK
nr:vitamin B12 dependent-methionine synthase activation domain-containing protein [Dehalobacterium formicoaceticum]